MTEQTLPAKAAKDHLRWVLTRLTLERDLRETTARGFALIAAAFGSFAIFDGLTEHRTGDDLPKAFSLVSTAVGVIVIVLAITHFRKMIVWVDTDEYGTAAAPELPDEQRPLYMAIGAVVIGIISFVALLVLR
jgi:uncharacterized membrane protein YidH (DUF202 family)